MRLVGDASSEARTLCKFEKDEGKGICFSAKVHYSENKNKLLKINNILQGIRYVVARKLDMVTMVQLHTYVTILGMNRLTSESRVVP